MQFDLPKGCVYELSGFRFSPDEKLVIRLSDDHRIWLHPREVELLQLFIKFPGQVLPKETISSEIWGKPLSRNIEKGIRQTVFVIRQALGKEMIKTGFDNGYSLATEAIPIVASPVNEYDPRSIKARLLGQYPIFVLVQAILFSLGCSIPLFLETAYRFDKYQSRIVPAIIPIFLIASGCSLFAFWLINVGLGRWDPIRALVTASIFLILLACLISTIGVLILPGTPITETFLPQAQTAQFAYAKSICIYLLPVFWFSAIVPFHTVNSIKKQAVLSATKKKAGREQLGMDSINYRGILNFNVTLMIIFLGIISLYSIYSSYYLLDNLRPSEYQGLFSFLLFTRNAVYFLTAGIGVWWYYENRKQTPP